MAKKNLVKPDVFFPYVLKHAKNPWFLTKPKTHLFQDPATLQELFGHLGMDLPSVNVPPERGSTALRLGHFFVVFFWKLPVDFGTTSDQFVLF